MLFVAGMRLRWILLPTLVLPPLAIFVISKIDPMRWSRLTVFLDPEAYKMTSGYQLWNSLLALGSGSWTGVGFTESRLKLLYLPENHTDFILSIVGWLIGIIFIIANNLFPCRVVILIVGGFCYPVIHVNGMTTVRTD